MLRFLISLFATMSATISLTADETEFYLGTYTRGQPQSGIYRGTLDTQTGVLGPITLAAEADDPSYVAYTPDGQTVLAVQESKPAAITAYRRESDGKLSLLNAQPTGGNGACYVAASPDGKVAFVANYGSGDIASYPLLENGSLGPQASFVAFEGNGPNPKRQKGPHAHAMIASPDSRHAYACDLGTDKVWIFDIDASSGELSPAQTPFATITPGGGPRHIILSADGRRAWVNHEMGLAATAFTRDPDTGALSEVATASTQLKTVEADPKWKTSAILLHPSEKYLYVTSRGDDTIAVFALAEDGSPELVQVAEASVKTPRGAAIDPTGAWFLVAGQADDTLSVLKIDPQTGKLSPTGVSATVPTPVCVAFSPAL